MHWFFKFLFIVTSVITIFLFIFVFMPKIMPVQKISNSEVSGLILRSQEWSGTIRVKGDIRTGFSTKITIKPGTIVLVSPIDDQTNFDLLPWHLKKGINTVEEYHGIRVGEPFWDELEKIQLKFNNLEAIGTKEYPIIITSESQNGSPYDINAINIAKGIVANAHLSNYRRLEIGNQTTIQNSKLTNTGECSVCINYGSPSVFGNIFDRSLRESIWIIGASPKIYDNLFINPSGAGIRVDPQRFGSPDIAFNTFEMPQRIALDILSGDEDTGGTISKNHFSGSSVIKLPCDSKMKFVTNNILGAISFVSGSCVGAFTFGSNFWGITDIKTILSERIIDKEKGFQILLPYVLKDPIKDAGRRNQN